MLSFSAAFFQAAVVLAIYNSRKTPKLNFLSLRGFSPLMVLIIGMSCLNSCYNLHC